MNWRTIIYSCVEVYGQESKYPILFFIICLDVSMEMTTDISMEATY